MKEINNDTEVQLSTSCCSHFVTSCWFMSKLIPSRNMRAPPCISFLPDLMEAVQIRQYSSTSYIILVQERGNKTYDHFRSPRGFMQTVVGEIATVDLGDFIKAAPDHQQPVKQ